MREIEQAYIKNGVVLIFYAGRYDIPLNIYDKKFYNGEKIKQINLKNFGVKP